MRLKSNWPRHAVKCYAWIVAWIVFCILLSMAANAAPKLESPRAGSVLKYRAMSIPVTEPRGPMTIALTKDINIFFCDTNDPACQLFDKTDVETLQRSGFELRVFLHDDITAEGSLVFTSGAAPYARTTGFSWLQPSTQRPPARFFSERQTRAPTDGFKPAAVGNTVEPAFRQKVTLWTRRR